MPRVSSACLAALLPCLAAMACPRGNATTTTSAAVPTVPTAVLAFTGNVRGWVEPCGCTADPLGGVDRIKAELAKSRQTTPTLFFDTGGLLFDRMDIPAPAVCQEEARIKLLLDSGKQSQLAFTGVGALDLARGEAFRAGVLAQAGLPAVMANVVGATGVVPHLLRDVGGIKVGFTGAAWPVGTALPAGDAPASVAFHGLQLSNPLVAVAKEAGALRQQGAKVVVVLSQMPRGLTVKLAEGVPGLDLLIQGHEPGEDPTAPQEVARGSWLISAGQQGQYLGRVTLKMPNLAQSCCLTLDDGGQGARQEVERMVKRAAQMETQAADFEARGDRTNAAARREKAAQLKASALALQQPAAAAAAKENNAFSFEALPLSSKVSSEPTLAAQLVAYKASLKDLNLACEKNLSCPTPPPDAAVYVGPVVCASCHQEQQDFWKAAVIEDPERVAQYAKKPGHPNPKGQVGHARAWQTLVDSKATGNRDCIACHSVGFEEQGGFCKVGDAPRWGNVSCESCHGPGSKHVEAESPAFIQKEVPEQRCRECHHVPHITSTESFVYAEKLKLILGKGHGEKRLKALLGKP